MKRLLLLLLLFTPLALGDSSKVCYLYLDPLAVSKYEAKTPYEQIASQGCDVGNILRMAVRDHSYAKLNTLDDEIARWCSFDKQIVVQETVRQGKAGANQGQQVSCVLYGPRGRKFLTKPSDRVGSWLKVDEDGNVRIQNP